MSQKSITGRLAAFVLEGGGAVGPLGQALVKLRDAMTLDLLERLRLAGFAQQIVLATDRPQLAAAAEASGFTVYATGRLAGGAAGAEGTLTVATERDTAGGRFDFGRVLAQLVRRWAGPPCTGVLCLGGAAAPLATADDWRSGLSSLLGARPAAHVLANNPQSPDVVAFAPPQAALRLGPVPTDNALAWALREQGLPRALLPPSPAFTFDIDTPIDALALHAAVSGGVATVGPRTAAALAAFASEPQTAQSAAAVQMLLDVLQQPLAEIGLIGRVGTPAIDHVNKLLKVRLRIFSEERGMKGLGREERGEVRSLLGSLLDDVGADRFFGLVTDVCAACLIDVRVLLGHWRVRLSDEDRFRLDLLQQPAAVTDPRLAAFVAAAQDRSRAGYPLLIGGHSLVSGGLQLLADTAAARAEAQAGGAARTVTTAERAGVCRPAAGKATFASENGNGVKR